MRKILVCGSRNFPDKNHLFEAMDDITSELEEFELVHGGHWQGADKMVEEWWVSRVLEGNFIYQRSRTEFKANWKKFGKRAGPLRNQTMADYCDKTDLCVAFRTYGKSNGTDDMIARAKKKGMSVLVYYR